MQDQTFFGEMTLVAGAYKHILVLAIVQGASEMGTLARDCPGFLFHCKENKLRSDNKLSWREFLRNLYLLGLPGDMESYEAQNRFD